MRVLNVVAQQALSQRWQSSELYGLLKRLPAPEKPVGTFVGPAPAPTPTSMPTSTATPNSTPAYPGAQVGQVEHPEHLEKVEAHMKRVCLGELVDLYAKYVWFFGSGLAPKDALEVHEVGTTLYNTRTLFAQRVLITGPHSHTASF